MLFDPVTQEACAESNRLDPKIQRARCVEAVARAKDSLLNSPQKVDTERLRCLLDVYREYDYEPVIVLRARVLERYINNRTLYIDDNPVVGTVTGSAAGVNVFPEWDSEWILKEMRQAMMSHLGKVNISEEERKLMVEAAKYFKNRSATAKARAYSKQLRGYDPAPAIQAGMFQDGTQFTVGAGNVDYETFVRRGLRSIIEETEARLHALDISAENTHKIDFYRAALISMNAVVKFANRYAELAERMAATEEDAVRKQELLDIAEVCRRVPEYPPRTFRESVQSWWFLHLGIQMEQAGCGSSPGRLGQYLDPYFQKDKAENGITCEDGIAWLKCLFVKILEFGYYQGLAYARLVSGHTGHTINIGGLKSDGTDATCELDYLLLDAQIDLRNIQPTLTLLYHDGLAEDFLFKAVELDRTGLGQPQWMNANIIIQRLLTRHSQVGITLEDARNCINMSCVGTGVAGKTCFIREIATFNLAKMVELVMTGGYDANTNTLVGADTGNPEQFASFEEFFGAFVEQTAHLFQTARFYGSCSNKALGDTVPSPFRSSMYDGCLQSGKHECEGGAKYYLYYSISTAGVDAANSLAAVKELVYGTGKVGMARLKAALAADFEGYEDVLELCLDAPKHGNGDPEMDSLVRRVYDCVMDKYHEVDTNFYGKHIANIEAYSLSIHNYFGMLTGALPCGRKKGKPLTDASVSAMPGTDKNGPLALVSSAARALDTVRYGSNHFNMKFHPSAVAGAAGARKLISLVKTYMDMGGSHIQFNIVSSETLSKAKATPEDYRALTVRVAGFSAYFTRLHGGVQDEIIARTELGL
ncbi:MAG: glycyl radical protein [Desulfovibrio sp.]|jgi:formate C-acetyltransferase|nr:glycyl radical protein [Desulfovibrio sp.]